MWSDIIIQIGWVIGMLTYLYFEVDLYLYNKNKNND